MKTSGIILAGGQSRRMQTNKALMEFNKDLLINHVCSKLPGVVDEIIIVTNEPADYLDFNAQLVTDLIPRRGPLSGIHAGLKAAAFDIGFVVACDMPFLSPELVSYMLQQAPGYDAVIPLIGEYYQPLHAVYHKNCIPHIENSLQEGRLKVTSFYEHIRIKPVTEKEIALFADSNKVFFNINAQEDLAKGREMIGDNNG